MFRHKSKVCFISGNIGYLTKNLINYEKPDFPVRNFDSFCQL